jgi:hypothetical protein
MVFFGMLLRLVCYKSAQWVVEFQRHVCWCRVSPLVGGFGGLKSCAVRDVGGVLGVAPNRLVRNVDRWGLLLLFMGVFQSSVSQYCGCHVLQEFSRVGVLCGWRSGYSIVGCVGV